MIKTAEELKQQAEKIGLTFYPVHDCSMCGYSCGYIITKDLEVFYDSGCDCSYGINKEERDWEDLAETYNMNQPEKNKDISEEFLDKLNDIWKFAPPLNKR